MSDPFRLDPFPAFPVPPGHVPVAFFVFAHDPAKPDQVGDLLHEFLAAVPRPPQPGDTLITAGGDWLQVVPYSATRTDWRLYAPGVTDGPHTVAQMVWLVRMPKGP